MVCYFKCFRMYVKLVNSITMGSLPHLIFREVSLGQNQCCLEYQDRSYDILSNWENIVGIGAILHM